jgi:CheY-like chemotaxis protein
MTDLVLDTHLDPEQRQHLSTVKVCAESLLRILGDILDFSKLEAGRQDLEERNFDPRRCIEDVLSMLSSGAKEKGLQLSFEIAEKTPFSLWGDDARLRQILVNLVGNAIKFTSQGSIVVRAWPESGGESLDGKAQEWIHFLVGDTGPGVLPDQHGQIFAPFEQGDAAMNRRHGGTGLGLAISKQLVELMGGQIWVESPWRESVGGSIRQGSAFHFTIRNRAGRPGEDKPTLVAPQLESSRTLRILLAEDNAVNRQLAKRILERMGHIVITAEDGLQALKVVGSEPVDLVLMDVQMPEMDGIEATRQIRRHERSGKRLPIVALTAHAMVADRENCLAAGMNDYLTKPIRREELYRVIEAVAATRVAGAA